MDAVVVALVYGCYGFDSSDCLLEGHNVSICARAVQSTQLPSVWFQWQHLERASLFKCLDPLLPSHVACNYLIHFLGV
jgi:hypothetical protein